MSRSRDIAAFLGKTEITNTSNNSLLNTASPTGLDSAQVSSIASASGIQVYATPDLLPTSGLSAGDQAFVTSNNRIYISNGSGWYNVALINSTPTFTSGPAGSYGLATDLTPTIITLVAQDSDGQVVAYSATADSNMTPLATLSQDSSVFTVTPLHDSAGGGTGSFNITFQATDGIGIASGVSTFNLSFGPDWTTTPTETKLTASDVQTNDFFGWSASISLDGNYAIVSSFDDGGAGDPLSGAGAAYIFTRSGSTWTEQAKLMVSDAAAGDQLGSVSISSDGSYVIVGARYEDTGGNIENGAAYIFTRSGSTWTQQAKLLASDAQTYDNFGWSVSISGDGIYAFVGADYEDGGAGDPAISAGTVYVFTRSGSTWTEQARLTKGIESEFFGRSISTNSDGTYVIIGSKHVFDQGAAYVFTRSGSTWTQQQRITPAEAQNLDEVGFSVAINPDATYAIIGSWKEDGGAGNPISNAGAAYIFTRSGSTWTQQAKLVASDAQVDGLFGDSVSISSDGTYAIVGAWYDAGTQTGMAYVFERSGSTWTQRQKLVSSDLQAADEFGKKVSISGDGKYAIVSAPREDGGAGDPISGAGAVYIYQS
jgi:hypothetical protein